MMAKSIHLDSMDSVLILFDMGEEGLCPPPPPNVFDHCTQTLKRKKLKLSDFHYYYGASEKVIFGSLGYPVLP